VSWRKLLRSGLWQTAPKKSSWSSSPRAATTSTPPTFPVSTQGNDIDDAMASPSEAVALYVEEAGAGMRSWSRCTGNFGEAPSPASSVTPTSAPRTFGAGEI